MGVEFYPKPKCSRRGIRGRFPGVSDKRKFRRLPLTPLAARVFQEGEIVDLSIAGAFVTSERPIAKGSSLTLEFALPGQGPVRVGTVVEWAGDYFEGEGGEPLTGMGLSFVSITTEARIAIARYLAEAYEVSRAAQHVRASLPARINAGEGWSTATVREVGDRGLFIETPVELEAGAELSILIRLPGAKSPIEAHAAVVERGTLAGTARLPGAVPEAGGATPAPDPAGDPRGLRVELREVGLRAREMLRVFIEEARETEI
jgi:hypothetical protein